MELIISAGFLVLILGFIVISCAIFTNAIEHIGDHFNLSEGAVGSVLAAVGTALPETIIPLVAIIGGYLAGGNSSMSNEIGIGAILGAPFMLGTLAFFVTGASVYIFKALGKRSMNMAVTTSVMFRDMHYFFAAYGISILSSFIPFPVLKHMMAIILIGIYVYYAYKTITDSSNSEHGNTEDIEVLYIIHYLKLPEPFRLPGMFTQLAISLCAIILLSHLFVEDIKHISGMFSISPLVLSLIITPIATELPEKFNSIIWIRSRKDGLAMGNITGAMVFQSCIPTAVGISLTSWVLSTECFINVALVYLSVAFVYFNVFRNKKKLNPSVLILGGVFYLIYLAYIISTLVK